MHEFAIAFVQEFIPKTDEFCFCPENELEFIKKEINRILWTVYRRSPISYEEVAQILCLCEIEERTDENTMKQYGKDGLMVPIRYYKVDKAKMRCLYLATRKLPQNITSEKRHEVESLRSRFLKWGGPYTASVLACENLSRWIDALIINDRGDNLLKWYQFLPITLYILLLVFIVVVILDSASLKIAFWYALGFTVIPLSLLMGAVSLYGIIKVGRQEHSDLYSEDHQILQKYALFILHPRIAESLCACLYFIYYSNLPFVLLMLVAESWGFAANGGSLIGLLWLAIPYSLLMLPPFYFRILGPGKFWRVATKLGGDVYRARQEQDRIVWARDNIKTNRKRVSLFSIL